MVYKTPSRFRYIKGMFKYPKAIDTIMKEIAL